MWIRDYLIPRHDDPLLDASESRKKYEMSVVFPFNDSADVTGKRLLSIYKDEKQSHGKHGSMMKIIWNFCKTRVIVASVFYTLSVLFSLLAPVIFLKLTLDELDSEAAAESDKNIPKGNETVEYQREIYLFKFFQFELNFYGRFKCLAYMSAFVGCFLLAKLFEFITLWLNLRTSIRLRTGVLAAIYRKALKSSVLNNISPPQILTHDIDNHMELVNQLTKIVGTVIAIIFSLIASIVLLGGPGIWPVFACIGFFCIPLILAKISSNRLKKSSHYLLKKVTLIHDFIINFKDIMVHSLSYEYIKHFYCE
jgi:ABC-type multidrug transport system fused ATPase/permease subunit